jgi:hypothetical protein
MEKQIQARIKRLFGNLTIPNNYNYRMYDFSRDAKDILHSIEELYKLTGKAEYRDISGRLSHTLRKELLDAEYGYKQTLKKRAARVRTTEFHTMIRQCIQQIDIDIMEILHDMIEDSPKE